MEKSPGQRAYHHQDGSTATAGQTTDGHIFRIAAKGLDVSLYPVQGGDDVQQSIVATVLLSIPGVK